MSSLEARWFLEGAAVGSTELQRWFRTAAVAGEPPLDPLFERRTDRYLWLGRVADLGIKLREGRLEVKGRREAVGSRSFGGRHRGRVERWLKWSLEAPPPVRAWRVREGGRAGHRASLAVEKARLLRKLEVQRGGRLLEAAATRTDLRRAVSAELTRVRWKDEIWWSIGFEGFPDGALRRATFEKAVRGFLRTLDTVHLRTRQSKGYPEWLQERVLQGGEGARRVQATSAGRRERRHSPSRSTGGRS